MRIDKALLPVSGILAAMLLGGCNLQAAMQTCADCGEVKSVTARIARDEIRLLTDAPTWAALDASGTKDPIVYDVRVRMDRGGSRDFVMKSTDLKPGDRVEVRGGALVVRSPAGNRWS